MKSPRFTARWLGALLALSILGGSLPPAWAASKSRENAWRIGTYVGSAATIAALAKGKGTLALIGGGATLLSYTQWRKEMKKRHRDQSAASYRRYRANWLARHRGRRVVRR